MLELLTNLLSGITGKLLIMITQLFSSFYGILAGCIFLLGLYVFGIYLKQRRRQKKQEKAQRSFVFFEQIKKELARIDRKGYPFIELIKQGWTAIFSVINTMALILVISGLYFLNLFPFWNRKRKKAKKEVKPKIRFKTGRSFVFMGSGFEVIALLLTCYLAGVIRELLHSLSTFSFTQDSYVFDIRYLYFNQLFDLKIFVETPFVAIPLLIVFSFLALKATWVNWQQYRDYNYHESGDDRFATLKELEHQYAKIADRGKPYKGSSGVPVAHVKARSIQGLELGALMLYNNKTFSNVVGEIEQKALLNHHKSGYYLIDQQTINMLMVGTTRSGKGEGWVNPMVDIMSRAEDKASTIIGDPKLELGQMAYKTLRKRGYDVQILSFQNMDFSLSYNPLALAIDAAKKGYYEKVQAQVNAVAEAIYRRPQKNSSGNEEYWQNTSIALFNAITLALIDRANEAYQAGEKDAWDTLTIRNVVTFLTELGSEEVFVDINNEEVDADTEGAEKKSSLTLYFDKLREANRSKYSKFREMADINYRMSDFAGGETRGLIYSSMMSGLNLFLQDGVAKLTSKNTIDLVDFGNPRRLTLRFRTNEDPSLPNGYAYQRATLNFYEVGRKNLGQNSEPKLLIKNARATIDEAGYMTYIVQKELPKHFRIEVTFKDEINEREIWGHEYSFEGQKTYKKKRVGRKKKRVRYAIDKYTRKKILTGVDVNVVQKPQSTVMDKDDIDFVYSEKPIALFVGIPPHRNEYGPLATLLIDQLFNANYEVALEAGRKNIRRIIFLLDEFTNLPAIPKIGQKLSIALGQNFQFIMFVQAIAQLIEKYGQEEANTIMGNCSLMGLIKTSLHETNEIFSKMLGKKTVTIRDKAVNPLKPADPHINVREVEQDLMTPTQLARMEAGEAVLVRTVKSHDLQGHKVTNDPILLMGKTEMPMRYMFLHEEFDQSTTAADIAVRAEHSDLDLNEISVAPRKTLEGLTSWSNELKKDLKTPFPIRETARIKTEKIAEQKEQLIGKVS